MCDRLRIVMNALTVLMQSNMAARFMEKLVSSATRVFRAITKVGGGGVGVCVRLFRLLRCIVLLLAKDCSR